MTSYYTRAKARGEQEDVEQGDLTLETTTTTASEIANVGLKDASMEGLESMSTEVAGPCPCPLTPSCCQRETTPPWVVMEFWGLPALPSWGSPPWGTPVDLQTRLTVL